MELETLTVVMIMGGIVMLYGAVSNRNPLQVIQLALQGKDISEASPLSTSSANDPGPHLTPDTEPDVPGRSGTYAPGQGDLSGGGQTLAPGAIPPGAI